VVATLTEEDEQWILERFGHCDDLEELLICIRDYCTTNFNYDYEKAKVFYFQHFNFRDLVESKKGICFDFSCFTKACIVVCKEKNPQLGELKVYDRTSPSELLERSEGAEVLVTNKTLITAKDMAMLPELKYIGVLATGYNVVDIDEAKARGIVVTNIPAYSTASVAQMVFAHILNITQRVEYYADENVRGRWTNNPDFCYWDTNLVELDGKKMGIVGYGNIGKATARIALAFGM
jgi:lactate dehydrogenase-like 2-hydroxyacid dehydrogenase